MTEPHPEGRKDIRTERPGNKSLILIDGRWAQVLSSNLNVEADSVVYLDDGSMEDIKWDAYTLTERIDVPLSVFEASVGRELEPEQLAKFKIGPEVAAAQGNIKSLIRIFGTYQKIKSLN